MTVCERCTLADCDDASSGCLLKQLAARADWKRRNGQAEQLTDDEHQAIIDYRQMWRLEDSARKSEVVLRHDGFSRHV